MCRFKDRKDGRLQMLNFILQNCVDWNDMIGICCIDVVFMIFKWYSSRREGKMSNEDIEMSHAIQSKETP